MRGDCLRFFLLLGWVLLLSSSPLAAGVIGVTEEARADAFALVEGGRAAVLWVDPGEPAVVDEVAVPALAADVERVTGVRPQVERRKEWDGGAPRLVIGTVGASSLIAQLVEAGRLDIADLKGQWEAFKIVRLPRDGRLDGGSLVIVGSDRRGTAYGVFELSRAIGVSPWSWWADVPVKRHASLYVTAENRRVGPPTVKYRGIFLNDEDWGLQPWAARTFEPQTKDIGPKTYAAIFELLLRLKANYIWPAMHPCTHAFNYYPDDKLVADRYAIVMGSSHAEPMLRDNVDEWKRDGSGEWNFVNNRNAVLKYWDQRIVSNGRFENVYTIGMRGIHDSGMPGGGSLKDKARRLERIFAAQRDILRRRIGKPVDRIPQLFIPYKEVLDIYRSGLKVPADVILGWVDDNHGYIRQLSNAAERRRPGGAGVYYHLSYWGWPHDYLWLESTPPGLVWEEMTKASEFGADRLWVVNVGDLKPAELGIDWFLRLAWNDQAYGPGDARRGLVDFFRENFGNEHAGAMADVMLEYYRLNDPRKPEHMGWNQIAPNQPVKNSELSHTAHGDEAQRRLDAFDTLETEARRIGEQLPRASRDAYFQLVLYPVQSAADMNRKIIHAEKSRLLAKQNLPAANEHARLAREAYERIQRSTRQYNEQIAGGKWRGIMSAAPRGLPVFGMPPVGTVKPTGPPRLVVHIEGGAPEPDHLPTLTRYTQRDAFIDLYNGGTGSIKWQAKPSKPWVKFSADAGQFQTHQRIHVAVDFNRAPRRGDLAAILDVSGAGTSDRLVLPVSNPAEDLPPGTFVDDNGVVSIDAQHFTASATGAGGCAWHVIGGVGYSGACVGLLPRLLPEGVTLTAGQTAPTLSYAMHLSKGGRATITLQALPTHPITENDALICAVSIDGGPPQTLKFEQGNDEHNRRWRRNVLRGAMTAAATIDLPAGACTLTIYGLDPSVVLDRIQIDRGQTPPAYLGARETRVVNTSQP